LVVEQRHFKAVDLLCLWRSKEEHGLLRVWLLKLIIILLFLVFLRFLSLLFLLLLFALILFIIMSSLFLQSHLFLYLILLLFLLLLPLLLSLLMLSLLIFPLVLFVPPRRISLIEVSAVGKVLFAEEVGFFQIMGEAESYTKTLELIPQLIKGQLPSSQVNSQPRSKR